MDAKPWHDRDSFWEDVAPFLFNEQRLLGTAAEIDQLLELVGMQPGMAVLDLPCGIGRHSCELAKRGYRVTAVDRTGAYLKRAAQQGKQIEAEIELVQADMRAFRRQEAFDVCLNLFSSFGYFEDLNDDRLVLQNFYQSLKPGGVLVMEMLGKEILARFFQKRSWEEIDEALFLQDRQISDGWDWIENLWIIVKDGQRRDLRLGHRLFSAQELKELIEEAGFRQTDIFG
ncbi:MAG: methyltransferase domain-containing protein, partial [Anaerolineales bacterium]|nr:methyltransferase domain-containing protein [Anaerolineales bacterium]